MSIKAGKRCPDCGHYTLIKTAWVQTDSKENLCPVYYCQRCGYREVKIKRKRSYHNI